MRSAATPARLSALAITIAAVHLASCADAHTILPTAPDAAPVADKGGNTPSISIGLTSLGNVSPTPFGGNTEKNANATCPAGSTVTEVDDATPSWVSGYHFSVSNDGTQLSFAPTAAGNPASAITEVIVKGGSGFDVYSYANNGAAGAAITSDGQLTSPTNHGGQIPTISHYIVCSTPVITFTKQLKHVFYTPAMDADDPYWVSNHMVRILSGETRWLQYVISYNLPSGVTGTVTEDQNAVCATAGAGMHCSFNVQPYGQSSYSWPVQGQGSISVTIDLINQGAYCDRTFTNTAVLTTSTGARFTAQASTLVWPAQCPS